MKGDKCLLTSFDLLCHIGQEKKIKKKHTVRAGQNFPPLAVLVLEYQTQYWQSKFSFGVPNLQWTF